MLRVLRVLRVLWLLRFALGEPFGAIARPRRLQLRGVHLVTHQTKRGR